MLRKEDSRHDDTIRLLAQLVFARFQPALGKTRLQWDFETSSVPSSDTVYKQSSSSGAWTMLF